VGAVSPEHVESLRRDDFVVAPELFSAREFDLFGTAFDRVVAFDHGITFHVARENRTDRTRGRWSPRRMPMRTDRRGFLRALGGAIAWLSTQPSTARGSERALEIHRATRNTRLGALGEYWPRLESPPVPFKSYSGRRLRLPAASTEPSIPLWDAIRRSPQVRSFATDPLSLPQLGRLLYFTNGVTGRLESDPPTALRAAPSAGALYAGEVYVLAQRVHGLEAGLYYYDVLSHDLVELRRGSRLDAIRAALEGADDPATAAAFVLLTNVFHRYHRQYADRGYRYALIDTGHIGENLRLATLAAGLASSHAPRFADDVLNDLLEVDGREEAVCAIHAVGVPAASTPGAARERWSLVEKQHGVPVEVASLPRVPQRYHEATKLVPGGAERAARVPRPRAEPLDATAVPLPKPAESPSMSAHASIRARRSPLRLVPQSIELETLAAVLRSAQAFDAQQPTGWVDLYLVAQRVTGLEPGVYRYPPPRHGLVKVRPGSPRRAFVRACLGQEMAGTGAAGCVMVGRLTEAASRAGDRSYRDLLVEAGEIGERVYLAAEALGIGARNLAAFLDDELNAFLGVDGRSEAAVHLTMLGVRE
jgi:SagB-type dehydrogenase family enzyme